MWLNEVVAVGIGKPVLEFCYYGGIEGMERRSEEMEAELNSMRERRGKNWREILTEGTEKLGSAFSPSSASSGLYTSASGASAPPFASPQPQESIWKRPVRETPEEEAIRLEKTDLERIAFVRSLMRYPIQNPVDKHESNVFGHHMDQRLADFLDPEEESFMPDLGAPYAPNHDPEAVQEWLKQQKSSKSKS